MTELELLAPAKNAATAIAAIDHGADAVYIGAPAFGARAAAGNSIADIAAVTDYAHRFNVRVFVTLNTILYDNEVNDAVALARELYRIGVDALIVQDMALLGDDMPPIALHASTQCDTRDPEKARFLADAGFSRIVLARELSLDEIRAIRESTDADLEAFVHGALCVSYSGDCYASLLATGRSANRGECAQMCRLPYRLTDASGKGVMPEAHYLSLRDMNRLDRLRDMADAGITSFKIEGRLKDVAYVKNTVAAYSRALDAIVASAPDRYRRSSAGQVSLAFTPDTDKTFNRGYTDYFLNQAERRTCRIASTATPKWVGQPVATVRRAEGKKLALSLEQPLNNGDGLGYFDRNGRFNGFRVNRAEGSTVIAAAPVDIAPGTRLYRNRDKEFDDMMAGDTARRTIALTMTLTPLPDGRIALSVADTRGNEVTATAEAPLETARGDQREPRKRVLSKLGDTVYTLQSLDDRLGDRFIPASALTALRRRAIALLDSSQLMRYRREQRRRPAENATEAPRSVGYEANVANRRAARFYKDHNITVSRKALEVDRPRAGEEIRVMTTRYCLRRELGCCLRHESATKLPRELFLLSGNNRYRLDFDCRNCEMHVVRVAENAEIS